MSKGNVTVLGVGRLGICMALSCERKGFNVLGVDVVSCMLSSNHPHFLAYVDQLNNKTFDSPEPLVSQYLKDSKTFKATTSLDEGLAHSDKVTPIFSSLTFQLFLLLATPTGVGEKSYDHSALSRLLAQIVCHLL